MFAEPARLFGASRVFPFLAIRTRKIASDILSCVFAAALIFCSAAFLAATAHAQTAAADTAIGSWKGDLGQGTSKLSLNVTITKLSNGEVSGQILVTEQGLSLPLNAINATADSLHFEVKSVGGVFDGKLNSAKDEIDGSWTQTNVAAQPLVLHRQAAATGVPTPEKPNGPTTKPFLVAMDARVPIAPTAFQGDGKMHLVYEVHLINMDRWENEITKFEVFSGDASAKPLLQLSGAALEGALRRPGDSAPVKAKFASGAAGFLFVWVTVDKASGVPTTLKNRFTVKVGSYPEDVVLDMPPTPVYSSPITIAPPFHGDHWVAANGPGNDSGHRRALIPIDGRAVIAQRFAIDWVKVGDDGKTYRGDEKDNKNYYCYGLDALAVADGVVTEVKDGIPQNIPGENSRAVPITLETVGGNHVIVEIGKGVYAFYAHLQPGGIKVKLGDKVKRGQVLGLIGNSGNSTEPHLHFHVSNANSPLGSEGLPYLLPSFEVQGHGMAWKPSDSKEAPVKHTLELPLEDEVVSFP